MLIVETNHGNIYTEYNKQPTIRYNLQCPLCTFQELTHRRYSDNQWIIAKCKSCGTWMIILKQHRNYITLPELKRAFYLMNRYIGPGKFRPYIGEIYDHFHLHWIQ